jgi:hypothetical protein
VKARHPLGAARHVVKFLAAFDCTAEVRYGFPDGGSRHSSLSRILPVVERTARIASFLKMVRKEFGVLLDRLSPKLYQSSGDLAVQLSPLVTKKGADGRILDQRMFELVAFAVRISSRVDKLGLNKVVQRSFHPS